MTPPIALQLYTLRQALEEDFAGVLPRIAEIGYVGVEPAGTPGTTPQEAGRLFKGLGLQVPSVHTALPLGDDRERVLDLMAAVGSRRIISGRGPADFETLDAVRRTCDLFNQAQAVAAEHGMVVGIHNHWWEFTEVEGQYPYRVMLERLDPAIFFQVDTYWVQVAGLDPAAVVRELGPRAPLLHVKDGPAARDEPQTAVGDGVLDFPSIVEAGAGTVEWHVVELDHCATDMLEAVERSYRYLVGEGLSRGNR